MKATDPNGTQEVTYTGTRKVTYATWGRNRKNIDGTAGPTTEWVHLGWTIATDIKKATAAGRSTNKYFMHYMVTPAS